MAVEGKPFTVKIAPKGEARIDWKVRAEKEGIAKIRMRAETEGDGDAVERELPVRVHGMRRQDAWSRVMAPEAASVKFPIEVPAKLKSEQTRLVVEYLLRGPDEVLLLDERDNSLDVPGKMWL